MTKTDENQPEDQEPRGEQKKRPSAKDKSPENILTGGLGRSTGLPVSRDEAIRQAIALNRDRKKLSRLVDAQYSVYMSEVEAHKQCKFMVRDARKITGDARVAQRRAVKIARREYAARKKMEMEYERVSKSLSNALSVLEKSKEQ